MLKEKTGLSMEAWVNWNIMWFMKRNHFAGRPQKGYHEAEPFMKWGFWEMKPCYILPRLAETEIWPCRSRNIPDQEFGMEQYELELHQSPLEEAAEQLF